LGCYVSRSSFLFNSREAYDDTMETNIRVYLMEVIARMNQAGRNIKRIVLMDDGGELLKVVNTFLENGTLT
jgi:hypothetical protein